MSSLKYLHILHTTILLTFLFELSWTQDNYVRYRCSKGTFFDFDQNICKPCSLECPRNQIIKKECQEKSDLECMPFKYPLIDISYENHGNNNGLLKVEAQTQGTTNRNGPREHDRSSNHPSNHPTAMETEDQEYWKALAFALIGLLSVLIVASVAVLFACCRLQRAVATKQQEDGDTVDTDSDYVVIRAIRTAGDPRPYDHRGYPAPHSPLLPTTSDYGGSDSLQDFHCNQPPQCFLPKVYNPQRRMVAYDTDDVFESEDSGGSVRFSSQQRVRATPWRPDHNLARPI